jgi:hypothetical protein
VGAAERVGAAGTAVDALTVGGDVGASTVFDESGAATGVGWGAARATPLAGMAAPFDDGDATSGADAPGIAADSTPGDTLLVGNVARDGRAAGGIGAGFEVEALATAGAGGPADTGGEAGAGVDAGWGGSGATVLVVTAAAAGDNDAVFGAKEMWVAAGSVGADGLFVGAAARDRRAAGGIGAAGGVLDVDCEGACAAVVAAGIAAAGIPWLAGVAA